MVLGDAVSKLETFLWILVVVHPKSIILGQMTNAQHDLSCGVSLSMG